MLNDLVNNTGNIGSSTERELYDKQCIEEIYGCINDVQCIACKNTQDIKDIKDTQDISVKSISATSVTATSITTSGIKSDNVGTKCINVSDKATVGSLESGDIKAEDIEANSIHTGNITGLNSLTVEGDVWADKVHTDNLDVVGCIKAERLDTDKVCTEVINSDINKTHSLEADCAYVGCFITPYANINNACIGNLSTSNLSSDAIDVSRITSTSLSVPKVETFGGITGKGTIDTTSAVWKEIKLPLFTGTVQFYTDEWKVTITGGREFIWEDPSLEHLKFISNDGETVTVAVDWDGEVYYTYNVAKEEPVITLEDNVGHTENNDHTFIMQDSGIPRGTVFIYKDKEYTNQGIDILGKVKASNLEITCSQSMDCVSIEHLNIGSSLISENPIKVDICARCFCIASPCSYISNFLYTNNIESDNICNKENIYTKDLYADNVNVKCEINATKTCSCDNVTGKLYVNECSEFHGPAYFYDNIYQCGETWCTHAQNVYTCSDTITMREGATFAGPAQIKVLKYDGTNNGVIYLGKDGTLMVGDEGNCQPVLTRSEEKDLSDGHGLVWDANNKCAKDSGEAIVTSAYVNCVGTECKKDACTYADNIGTECKKDACAYANTVSFCNINVCRGLSTIGTSTYCDSKCWGTNGNWAYLTFTEAPDNHWHYVIKMDGYDACRRAGFAFPADDFQQQGVYYKLGFCGGNDGWKLIPDITCVQKAALSCGKASETLACTYANTVAGQCKGVACTYANCTVNSCKGIGVMGVARTINGQCWTKGGYWAYMTTIDGPTSEWSHVIKMDWSANVDPWISGISIPTYDAPNNGIYYKTGCCGGHSGWTLVPDISCVQTLSGSCASSIGTACKNAACAFAAACASAVVPETSTFAKSYGGSTNCVAYADKVKINASGANAYYKIPFIERNEPISENKSLYVDSVNSFPTYNPFTNVFCGYTVCVAQTLAVRNANGGLRLGNYCIYIG